LPGRAETNVLIESYVETAATSVTYEWFCSISFHDLPPDPEIGKVSRRGMVSFCWFWKL